MKKMNRGLWMIVAGIDLHPVRRLNQIQSGEITGMSSSVFLRSQLIGAPKARGIRLCTAALAFALVAVIAMASGTVMAEDNNGVNGVLDATAAGRDVSPRVSLRLQMGFACGGTVLYITPELASTRPRGVRYLQYRPVNSAGIRC